MDSPIWVLFLLSISIHHLHLTIAQRDFFQQYCGVSGNFTQNSGYQQNLDDVLYSLTGTNNGFGSFDFSSGQANAAALCRGDMSPDSCRRCVDDATRRLRQLCPNQVEAGGWYDACFLTYSNRTMESDVTISVYGFDPSNISDSSFNRWNRTVSELLGGLRGKAAVGEKGRKYASGNVNGPESSIIYGMVQCTPDISSPECDRCLLGATGEIGPYDRSLGVRVYKPSCLIRYENYPFFNSTWYPSPPSKGSGKSIGAIVGPTLSVMVIIAVILFIFRRRQKRKQKVLLTESQDQSSDGCLTESKHQREDDDTEEMNYFNLSTIQAATNNFSAQNKLGEGGFGPVYKGKLQDGVEIAVKRLSWNSGQGLVEFKTEVELIIKLQHKNLVRLLGYCVKGMERLLIYEFMANNSLDAFIFDPIKCKELDWAKRANIVSGIAKGLRYLHEDSRLKIIHRDMKASNILLDDEMNSKISDFGTARIFGGNQMEANTNRIVGTYGYMAPEYAMEGLFSTKSDVYSFGVLLLEIISGQRNNKFYHQEQPQNFLSMVWRFWKENKGEQLIDRHLIQNCPVSEAHKWINIALLCVQENPQDRPNMSTVVFMLEGQWATNLPIPSEPPLSFARFVTVPYETTSTSSGTAYPSTNMTNSTSSASS